MSLLDRLTGQAGRLADEVQVSLRRARAEGERRLLARQHRAALEELGERAYELVRSGVIPREPLSAEMDEVDRKLAELNAKAAEADTTPPAAASPGGPTAPGGPITGETEGGPGPGPGWEAANAFFASGDRPRPEL